METYFPLQKPKELPFLSDPAQPGDGSRIGLARRMGFLKIMTNDLKSLSLVSWTQGGQMSPQTLLLGQRARHWPGRPWTSSEGVWRWAAKFQQTAVEPFEVSVSFQAQGQLFLSACPQTPESARGVDRGGEGEAHSSVCCVSSGIRDAVPWKMTSLEKQLCLLDSGATEPPCYVPSTI